MPLHFHIGLNIEWYPPVSYTHLLQYVEFNTNYIGELTRESMTGGLLSCNPILYFSFLLPNLKRIKKPKTLISYLTFPILGILIIFIDIQCAGLLQRYISDFAIFIFIGTTPVSYTHLEVYKRQI